MSNLITPEQLKDAGFRAEQFGTPSDWDVYLAAVVVQAGDVVKLNVGVARYDAVVAADDGDIGKIRLSKAEFCSAKAELWTRRAAFIDSNAAQAMDGAAAHLNRRAYLDHAKEAQACAAHWMDAFMLGGDDEYSQPVSDLSTGAVVTGPFAAGAGFTRVYDRVGIPQ